VEILGDVRVGLAPGASVDEVIGAIADAQRGRVSREQLLSAGIDRAAIWRRLRSGRLDREHRNVYALPHTADIPLAMETGALLACGPGAALSHHSAATLWGLRPGVARPVHVTIPAHRGFPAPSGVKLHRSRILTPADIRTIQGLPTTSPARTLLDVAGALPDRDVERLLSEAMYARRMVTLQEIRALVKRAGGHPGRLRLARVAGTAGRADTESPVQEMLVGLIRDAGLPMPQTEVPVLDYRLDLFWPELNLAVEVDAYGTHGSPGRFESDRRKDARLLAELGISVMRVTRAAVERRPLEALALVAREIGQRQAAVRSARSRSR
jgi:very-short-patch-repair endonuclease